MLRFAKVSSTDDAIAAYLPARYSVVSVGPDATYIRGEDLYGWTLDGYVIPRLASGLYFCEEMTEEEWNDEIDEFEAELDYPENWPGEYAGP